MPNKYQQYKPSGVEWIGDIPSHWHVSRLKQLAAKQRDSFIDGDWIESKDISTSGIRYITTGNIGSGKFKEQGSSFITEETFLRLNCTELFPGDLVISRLFSPVGRSCILPNLGRVVTSVDNVILRPNDKCHKPFLNYYFNWQRYNQASDLLARGTTLERISRSILGNNPVVLPPIEEQKKIAEYLDIKTALIDETIRKKQRLIELLEEERDAVINYAVTRGLNENVNLKVSGVDWLGEIPANWEVKKLKYVSRSVSTGSTPPSNNERYYENGTLNWFTPSDFSDAFYLKSSKRKVSEAAIEEGILSSFPDNSVLIVGIGATLGKTALAKGRSSSNQQINAIDFDSTKLLPPYGLLYFRSIKTVLMGLSNSATLAILNQFQTKNLPIIVPPLDVQKGIIDFVMDKCQKIEKTIEKEHTSISLFQEFRMSLINEVVTGNRCVVEQTKPQIHQNSICQ